MTAARGRRLVAIDVMRGIVMLLMSIDHASDAFNGGRVFTDSVFFWKPGTPLPTAQFLTRWITHLCAPTFVLLAGAALAISTESRLARGESARSIDRHIVLRGALIALLDVVWMSWAMIGPGRVLFQVLFAIGGSLVCMAALRRLSDRALFGLGLAIAVGGELLVGVLRAPGEAPSLPAAILLTGGFFADGKFVVAYPLLPWVGIMCLGWAFGRSLVRWSRAAGDGAIAATRAARVLAVAGLGALGVFVIARGLNGYGNMLLLRESGALVQWLHVSKYPPSLTYDALELGLAALTLAALFAIEARRAGSLERWANPVLVLGQVALFFYLLHLHLLELVAWVFDVHGRLGLASAYVGAVGVVVALYPACARYRRYKAAHPDGWTRFV